MEDLQSLTAESDCDRKITKKSMPLIHDDLNRKMLRISQILEEIHTRIQDEEKRGYNERLDNNCNGY